MLKRLLSKKGWIGRGEFFWTMVVLNVAVPLGFGALIGAAMLLHIVSPGGAKSLGAVIVIGFIAYGGLTGWVNVALQFRRMRDIGWEPALVIPCGLLVWLAVDVLVLVLAPDAWSRPAVAAVNGIVFLLYCGMLCLLPSQGAGPDDIAEVFSDTPRPTAPQATLRPAMAGSPGRSPGGFGRRGD